MKGLLHPLSGGFDFFVKVSDERLKVRADLNKRLSENCHDNIVEEID